ncbi:tocopherol cyclase family protein [Desulfogranum marinum]|uniref:tocopherol cyclase family protein n=1 Tax=Desulfogranum marinum TaxID=453220 RepID=UPI001965CB14|nr:tocopherol cyclase family protein [Desulfogranum marinum]MBM9514167.1 hypothetical protein [Desulfogranum marinum]
MKKLVVLFSLALGIFFLNLCFGAAIFAENMTDSQEISSPQKTSSHTLAKLQARSNFVEKFPDITDTERRDTILGQTARAFLGDQIESLSSDPLFFKEIDTEGPWFKGWYTRITGTDGTSIAVVGASQYLPGQKFTTPYEMHIPGYLAVIVSDHGRTKIYETFPKKTILWSNRELALDAPDSPAWESFLWHSENGFITNESIEIAIPGKIELTATLGARLPYNSNTQWLGPEGLVEFLPIVPLHWFVYTLGSNSTYHYTLLDEKSASVKGHGYAHQESNWGNVFPPAWIWSEGINSSNTRQLALSGGELSINGSLLTTWLVAYHSPVIQWQFRPTLPGTDYLANIDACSGKFAITAKDVLRKIVIEVNAPLASFIDVSVPTETGFTHGAKESFSANVTVNGYIKLPWLGYILIDRYQFTGAALEFGADYMCGQD